MLSPRSLLLGAQLSFALACGAEPKQVKCPPTCEQEPSAAVVARAVTTSVAVEDLEVAFKQAIAAAGPAVVSVYSTKTVSFGGPQSPFGDDPLFERFFDVPRPHPRQFRQQGLGSGFVIDEAGHILTNNHVIEGAEEVRVKLDDDREFDARVIGTDPPTDLALLQIDADKLRPLEYGDSDALEVGDWVLAIGNPFNLQRTVSAGIVSAKGRVNVGIIDYEDFIQTDAAVNPGNSGGPLVDLEGRVVGINTAIASRAGTNSGVAFAVPINMAKTIVEQLMSDGKVVRGYLGILISELSPELADSFAYEREGGILVQDVTEGSAAAEAGLQNGDIITKLDGQKVSSVAAFRSDVAAKPPGTTVTLEVWREGKLEQLRATLGEGPDKASPARVQPPKLGIELRDITPELRAELGLEDGEGVVISKVEPGSPAAAAGLRPGDVLEEIGSKKVERAAQAVEMLGSADLEGGVRLRLRRDGRGRFVIIKVRQ